MCWTTTSKSSGKNPGETSTGAEDYVAKEVFWLRWVWMFYLSAIKGIDLYGVLALEKLIYFWGDW